MYIELNGYIKTVKVSYFRYSLFKKRKIYKVKTDSNPSSGHYHTIIKDTDNVNDIINRWKENEEKNIADEYREFYKWWHDIKVEVTMQVYNDKIADMKVIEAMKLLTPQQFKEEFGYLIYNNQ